MSTHHRIGLAFALALTVVDTAYAAPLPTRVGACSTTRIDQIGTRLVDGTTNAPVPDSGSAVTFVNGGYQVSYDVLPAITHSRPGDAVRVCLVSIPHSCPPGDNRGRVYRTRNLRTGGVWELPDSEHMCGGA